MQKAAGRTKTARINLENSNLGGIFIFIPEL
jgi:hypothetical protein